MSDPMTAAELRPLNDEEIEERLKALHGEWRDLRFQEAVGQLTATHRTREVRKEIARIHTIMTERKTAASQAATTEPETAENQAARFEMQR